MPLAIFDHPPVHVRKHAPKGYTGYKRYKDYLRDEFTFRCVYCLERERWYPSGHAAFSADHVIPQDDDESRIADYENLIYACIRCNSARKKVKLVDPTASSIADHLRVLADGKFEAITDDGKDLIDFLHLNVGKPLAKRQEYLRILELKEEFPHHPKIHALYVSAFGYPDDLPNLVGKKPPGGNVLEANEVECYYARKSRNDLADVY